MKPKALLFWSSGKDSAWTLHVLRQRNEVEVVGLVTMFREPANRVTMHEVRRELVEGQARAIGLPLWSVEVPWPCDNATYEFRMKRVIAEAQEQQVTHFAFGDLFLQDIRAYRERQLAGTGIVPIFPLWDAGTDTPGLARTMVSAGLSAIVTCVDSRQLAARFVGREFDAAFLADLPAGVDPCGERGEFHTFCYAGPRWTGPVSVRLAEGSEREGFHWIDLLA